MPLTNGFRSYFVQEQEGTSFSGPNSAVVVEAAPPAHNISTQSQAHINQTGPSSEMDNHPSALALEVSQPGPKPSASITKRHTAPPQLKISTSGLSTLSVASLSSSDRSPRLSPTTSSPNRAGTFPMSKADAVREEYVRSMEERLLNWESNPLTADPLPVPRFILDNCSDEVPPAIRNRRLGENGEAVTLREHEGIFDFDYGSHYALSHGEDLELSCYGNILDLWHQPQQQPASQKSSDLLSPRSPFSSAHHRRRLTSESGTASSTFSRPQLHPASSYTSLTHLTQACESEKANVNPYETVLDPLPTRIEMGNVFDCSDATIRPQESRPASSVIASSAAQKENLQRTLSPRSISIMNSLILNPLVNDERFKEFHGICHKALQMLQAKSIGSLRDLEKQLIHTAISIQPYAFLDFCKAFLQYLEKSIQHLPEGELIREYDRPYTKGYFLDIEGELTKRASMINSDEFAHKPGHSSGSLYGNEMDVTHDFTEDAPLEVLSPLQCHLAQNPAKQVKRTALQSAPSEVLESPAKKQKLDCPAAITVTAAPPSEAFDSALDLLHETCMMPPRGTTPSRPSDAFGRQPVAEKSFHVHQSPNSSNISAISSATTYQYDPHKGSATRIVHSRTVQGSSVGASLLPTQSTKEETAKEKVKQNHRLIPGQVGKGAQIRRSTVTKCKATRVSSDEEQYYVCETCAQRFARMCDLTKHEKTHTRPHKCPVADCKYHTEGFPTEKEKERHISDKHSDDGPVYPCEYPPCPYKSKRQSNCKQHMEKAHGYQYVRTKSNTRAPNKKTADTIHVQQKSAKPAKPRQQLTRAAHPTHSQAQPSAPLIPSISSNLPMEQPPSTQGEIPNHVPSQMPPMQINDQWGPFSEFLVVDIDPMNLFSVYPQYAQTEGTPQNSFNSPISGSQALRSENLDPTLPVMGNGYDLPNTNSTFSGDQTGYSMEQYHQPNTATLQVPSWPSCL